MVKWALLAVLGIFVSLSVFLFFRLGLYKSVEMNIVSDLQFHFLYKEFKGPYHKILNTIQEVEAFAKTKNIACTKTFGEYLDDPAKKNEVDLVSNGGCVLTSQIDSVDAQSGILFKSEGPSKYLKASFLGSPSVGPIKVYPKALEWFKREDRTISSRVLEVYVIQEDGTMVTEYYFPLGND